MEKNNDIKMPAISKELIEVLNQLFPERSAELEWTEKEVWFRTGQRNIIRFLNSHFAEQNKTIMEKK
jgi:hypothetical protein